MILDACCGALMMYHGWEKKLGDDFVYIDVRKQETQDYGKIVVYKRAIKAIKPLILADMRYLPFKDGIFDAVIADPPHLDISLGAYMAMKYGSWKMRDIVRHMRAANVEFTRVLKPNGILLLKIMAEKFQVYEYLLSNFTFFLPIEYESKSHHSSETVGWYVATLKAETQMLSSPAGTDSQAQLGQPAPEKAFSLQRQQP